MNYIAIIAVLGIVNAWIILFVLLRTLPKPWPKPSAIALLALVASNLLIVLLASLASSAAP